MTDAPSEPDRSRPRERPTHWAHPVNERRRLRRVHRHYRRRIVLGVLVVLIGALVGTYWYLTSDVRVEAFAERYLRDLLGTQVKIDRAHFTLHDGLVLEGLRVMPPQPFQEPLLVADRVNLVIDPIALAALRIDVSEIVVHRPLINLVLWNEKVWNFQAMIRRRPEAAAPPALRPVFTLEEGTVRIKRKLDGEAVYEQEVRVSGLLLPSERDPHMFRFQTDVSSPVVHLAVASGFLDGRTGELRFEGQASNVALTNDLYKSLPREAQRVWDRFEPTGSVNLKVVFDEKEGLQLVAELTGVQFTWEAQGRARLAPDLFGQGLGAFARLTGVPVPWNPAAEAHRFTNLTGRCAFTPKSLTLTGVQGLLDGSPLRLSGTVNGFDRETLDTDLAVAVDNVRLEEVRGLLVGLAPHMTNLYEIYAPRGPVDVAVRIARRAATEPAFRASGTITCRGTEITYRHFPYRVERLRGKVRFSPEEYTIDGLEGVHGGARIRLTGWARNPGPLVKAEVTVSGTDVALDDDLRQALAPYHRGIWDQYAPSGTVDLDVKVSRAPVAGARPTAVIDMQMRGCEVCYAEFPYRLTDTRGRVVIEPDRTRLLDVVGRHGGAAVLVRGDIVNRGDGPPAVDLRVAGRDVRLEDDDLAAALPARERETLRLFHLAGLADFEGTVTRGPEEGAALEYDLDIGLKGARLIHEEFPFLAEQVTGRLHLARGLCRIESLRGHNAGAVLEARGWVEQRPDDYAVDVALTAEDLLLDEQLRGALGPGMRAAWRRLAPHGRVDVEARLVKAFGPEERLRHHVWVTPRQVSATFDIFPYPLESVTGRLEFEGDEVRLHDVAARSGAARFALGGRIAYGEHGPSADLELEAHSLRLEGPFRRAVPAPLQGLLERFSATGRIDLSNIRIAYRPTGPDTFEASWKGSALLDEVALVPGVRVSGVVGTADVEGRWDQDGLGLDARAWVQQGSVAGMAVSDLRLVLHKDDRANVLVAHPIEGEFYGGRIEGTASVGIGDGGRFGFDLAVADVAFERLLREGFHLEYDISGGRLRGTLALAGQGADPAAVQASGRAEITQARLYQLPLLVRLLNVLRLAPGDETAFREARIDFFVRGKRVIFEDIRLQGPAVSLYGAGTMEPDGQLALTFMTGKKDDRPLVPAIAELVEGLRRELAVVQVTGTLAEPKVEVQTLWGAGAPLRELLAHIREERARRRAR